MIIALSGKLGSGKDTVADIITEYLLSRNPDLRITRIAFATPLKQYVADLTDTEYELGCTRTGKATYIPKYDMTIAQLHQYYGELMRINDPDYWCDIALQSMTDSDLYIITDLRYRNEYAKLREMGAHLWRINRANDLPNDGRDNAHVSETDLDAHEFDRVIDNNCSMSELRDRVMMSSR